MFDGSLPGIADLTSLTDADLVDAIGAVTRAENAACAVKVVAMAELFCRRTGLMNAEDRDSWWVDPEAAVAAEIGAAGGISQGLALSQTHRGVALRDRLPKIAALFAAGMISDLLVRAIVWRTALVTSPDAMARLDCGLADRVTRWGALSVKKTEQAIDELVENIDAGALRRTRGGGCARGVQFGSPADEPGFMTMWARVYATDGVVIEQRVDEIARNVCDADPRSADERHADALFAAVNRTDLACECGQADCPGAAHDRPAKSAVVYVLADENSVDAATAGQAKCATPNESAPNESAPGEPAPASSPAQCVAPPAFVFGAGMLPTALLGGILERATIRQVRHPGAGSAPDPRYVPSLSTADFVRCRDLTCRFPGCDKPAQFCDLDHTTPYPYGPTHPSNTKLYCRTHHLIKTFYAGFGWKEQQFPDGTVAWTAPTRHIYSTQSHGGAMFPALTAPTGELADVTVPDESPHRGLMMPTRRQTREQDRRDRITEERRQRKELNTRQERKEWAWLAANVKPPPF
jgi:hypothetical protein